MDTYFLLLKAPTSLAVAATLCVSVASSVAQAQEQEFEEAEIFFELNNTDGDLGIHGKVDGGPWTRVTIEDAYERRLMGVISIGSLWWQEVTELFFESAEPTFDELSPERFFRRFPEGTYEIEGWSREIGALESETEVTHALPAPPVPTVGGEEIAEVCDEEDPDYDATETSAPVVIAWDEVTMSHPDLGTMPPVEVEIVNYELVVETEIDMDGEEFVAVMSVILPPEQRSMTIPEEFTDLNDEFKYEVLAREESFNQTAVESCFVLD